ncbi:uncharacterized protein LOC114790716 [Denticeps clupeoides]|uniref:Ig-like domain-containing protein n=1 Tax=Denticeps clupeoides TaxID=299321 RepID=A0AAY4AI05_9TELE|nr:uncharacterized protein LOC114790716 [Denticeps clupeoides]
MKTLLFLALLAFVHFQMDNAYLLLQGPAEPVVEGELVTLECVDSDAAANMSQVYFERYSKMMDRWYRLDLEMLYRRCFYYDVDVIRSEGRVLLTISNIQSYTEGPYRCASDSNSVNSSAALSLTVHYMRDLSFYQPGSSFSRYFSSLQDLRVSEGDDVEVECSTSASETPSYLWSKEGGVWVQLSKTLKLLKVTALDSGNYTCTAKHPSVSSLLKTRTVSIVVLSADAPWYETTSGQIMLMTSASGLALLVAVLSMTVFLCRRARQKKSKGPIDDHSKKKPIYTASTDSLTSTTADKQPLV